MLWEITPDQKKVEIKGWKALIGAEKQLFFETRHLQHNVEEFPIFVMAAMDFDHVQYITQEN